MAVVARTFKLLRKMVFNDALLKKLLVSFSPKVVGRMNGVRCIRSAGVSKNRKLRIEAADEIAPHRLCLECIDFEDADDFLDQFRCDFTLTQFTWTEEVADDILLVLLPCVAALSLLFVVLHRLDLVRPSLFVFHPREQHPQGSDAVELNASRVGIGQIEKFAFRRFENLAFALVSGKFAQF
jgi:hypothetical protein